jgi:hypothetical protein
MIESLMQKLVVAYVVFSKGCHARSREWRMQQLFVDSQSMRNEQAGRGHWGQTIGRKWATWLRLTE